MDSITKLQSKLAEAENILKYVSKELNGYAQDKSVGSNLNFAEIKLRGEQYSFYEHPLKNQMFQDEYFALMIYVISLGGKKEEGWTILYRIAAGCDYQKDLQYLTTDAMTFTEERLSEIIRLIYSADMARTFAIDSLMICFHMGADDAQLKFLANLYDLLKLDKNFLAEAIQFVKIFDSTFWDNPAGKSKAWTILTAKDIATYIGGTPATSFGEASNLKANRVIILNATHTSKNVLLLDNWKPNEILFLNCHFENCGGIYSANKVVKFLSCSFDQSNLKRRKWNSSSACASDYMGAYSWTNKEYSNYKELYHFENASFVNCIFKHFNDATPFLYLERGLIHGCTFEDIKQYPAHCILFTINNAEVLNTQFVSCSNSMPSANNVSQVNWGNDPGSTPINNSCLIYSQNTVWKSNKFNNCFNIFREKEGWGGYYARSYLLLLDKQSHCNNCVFENIAAYIRREEQERSNDGRYNLVEKNYDQTIVGLHDSTANKNEGATVTNVNTIVNLYSNK